MYHTPDIVCEVPFWCLGQDPDTEYYHPLSILFKDPVQFKDNLLLEILPNIKKIEKKYAFRCRGFMIWSYG